MPDFLRLTKKGGLGVTVSNDPKPGKHCSQFLKTANENRLHWKDL